MCNGSFTPVGAYSAHMCAWWCALCRGGRMWCHHLIACFLTPKNLYHYFMQLWVGSGMVRYTTNYDSRYKFCCAMMQSFKATVCENPYPCSPNVSVNEAYVPLYWFFIDQCSTMHLVWMSPQCSFSSVPKLALLLADTEISLKLAGWK